MPITLGWRRVQQNSGNNRRTAIYCQTYLFFGFHSLILFCVLSHLHRMIHKSNFCIVYGKFKVVSSIMYYVGSWVLLSFFVIQKCVACWSWSPTLNCHANRVAPFVLFGFLIASHAFHLWISTMCHLFEIHSHHNVMLDINNKYFITIHEK